MNQFQVNQGIQVFQGFQVNLFPGIAGSAVYQGIQEVELAGIQVFQGIAGNKAQALIL